METDARRRLLFLNRDEPPARSLEGIWYPYPITNVSDFSHSCFQERTAREGRLYLLRTQREDMLFWDIFIGDWRRAENTADHLYHHDTTLGNDSFLTFHGTLTAVLPSPYPDLKDRATNVPRLPSGFAVMSVWHSFPLVVSSFRNFLLDIHAVCFLRDTYYMALPYLFNRRNQHFQEKMLSKKPLIYHLEKITWVLSYIQYLLNVLPTSL